MSIMVTYIYTISKVIGENKHIYQEATQLLIERKNIQPVLTAGGWLFLFIHAPVILCLRAVYKPRKGRLQFWGKPTGAVGISSLPKGTSFSRWDHSES